MESQGLIKNLPRVALPLNVIARDVDVTGMNFLAGICANVILRFKKMLTTIFLLLCIFRVIL